MPNPHSEEYSYIINFKLTFNTSAESYCAANVRGVLPLWSGMWIGSGSSDKTEQIVLTDPVITAQ